MKPHSSSGQSIPLHNFFSTPNSTPGLGTPTKTPSYDATRPYPYPTGAVPPGPLGNWPVAHNFTHDTSSPIVPTTSPFSGVGPYGSSFDPAAPSLFSSTGITKRPVDLFSSGPHSIAAPASTDFMHSVNVVGPSSAPTGQSKNDYAAMPSLPPVATGVRQEPQATPTPPNNYHHPEVNPSELRSRLLSLSTNSPPVSTETLKTVRPVDLPPSEYRRDIMAADRHAFAYISHLRNVGNAVRVWRRTDKSPETGNPFANASAFMLKEHINSPTDIHLTTSKQDETMVAVGDSTGNVSVHVLPVTPKDSSASPSAAKYCVLRIISPEGASPVKVLRVTWHPILPQVLAIAYSDGFVSVWNIAQVLADYHSRPGGQSSLADLVVSPPNTYPITFARPPTPRAPLVISVSHGSETVTDVCLWGNTIFSSTAYGHVYMSDLATGNIQRVFRVHQHGVGAMVLATCPAVDSGYMPIIATTSGDGSEVKLWRHASHLADWTCLQSLTLPVQATPYILSRYAFDDTFLIYNPVAGTAWELKLFLEESALLPGNFFSPIHSHGLLLIATSNVIIQYAKDTLTITSYPPPSTYSKANLTSGPAVVVQPIQSIPTTQSAITQTAPTSAEYHQHQRENSFSSNPHSAIMQTQVPPASSGHGVAPVRNASVSAVSAASSADGHLPQLPPRPASQGSAHIHHQPSPHGNNTASADPSTSSRTPKIVVAKSASSVAAVGASGGTNAIQAVQALLEESSRNLGDMIAAEEERWKSEDKKFLLKVNEAMRLIPNTIADVIRSEIDKIPQYAVDVPELTRALGDALGAPIGAAFREQFTDVLVPALEDTTAQMLRKVDAKLKTVANQHAQTIAQNDVARSVEPLVSTLMAATAEMTKSLNSLKPLQFPGGATVTAPSSTATSTSSASSVAVSATPSKKSTNTATTATATASTPSQTQQQGKGKKDKKDAADKTILKKDAPTSNATHSASTASKSQANGVAPTNTPSKSQSTHASWYWLFALSHGVHL